MSLLRLTACLGAAVICISCRTSQPSEPWFYVVAADPQLYMKQKDDAFWKATVDGINGLKPEFVIVCGDLINAANDTAAWSKPAVMAQHNALADDYWAVAKQLNVPLYNVAGNHDVGLRPTAQTIAWYRKRFAEPWYAFEHRNSLFVVIESNLIRDDAGAPDIARQQWQWLTSTLEAAAAKEYTHKTLYMHHPLCRQSVNEKDDYFNVPQAPRQRLLKLLHEHNFAAVFCGHFHKNAYMTDGDLEIITTASCCAPLGKDPRGLRIVSVYPDRIEHSYHAIDKLPAHAMPTASVAKPSN